MDWISIICSDLVHSHRIQTSSFDVFIFSIQSLHYLALFGLVLICFVYSCNLAAHCHSELFSVTSTCQTAQLQQRYSSYPWSMRRFNNGVHQRSISTRFHFVPTHCQDFAVISYSSSYSFSMVYLRHHQHFVISIVIIQWLRLLYNHLQGCITQLLFHSSLTTGLLPTHINIHHISL